MDWINRINDRLKVSFLLLAAICLGLCACSKKQPPPLRVSFRQSLLDSAGLVMQVQNTGDRSLACLMIAENKTLKQGNQHVFSVGPRANTEVGMMQTSWSFRSGETVELRVEGYSPFRFEVP